MKLKLDWIGIGTSALCSVHCVLLPILLSSLPVAGINLLENFWIEAGMVCIAFTVGVIAFYQGCFKKHKNKKPLLLFVIGFSFLLVNLIKDSNLLVLGASLLIVSAHFWNYRLLSKHYKCAKHPLVN